MQGVYLGGEKMPWTRKSSNSSANTLSLQYVYYSQKTFCGNIVSPNLLLAPGAI